MTYPGVYPDADFIQRMDYILSDFDLGGDSDSEDSPTVTPAPKSFTEPQSEEDAAFIKLIETFIAEDVEAEYDRLMVMHKEYLPLFEAIPAKQLTNPRKYRSEEERCYYITYTNNTEFDLDVTIYGDYFTAEYRYFTDKIHTECLKPGETVTLYMRRMPKDVANWVADWVVHGYYVDGIDIYDYY